MIASVLLKHVPEVIDTMLSELMEWMQEHEYVSVDELKGALCQDHCSEPKAFERVNYMKALTSYSLKEW